MPRNHLRSRARRRSEPSAERVRRAHAQAARRADARGRSRSTATSGSEAGKPGALRPGHPRGVRRGMGAEDYRFNAVSAEVTQQASTPPSSSCFGIHSDVCPPVHRRPRHPGAEGALVARHGRRREDLRDRDDRAQGVGRTSQP
jgi:hypothetical protein